MLNKENQNLFSNNLINFNNNNQNIVNNFINLNNSNMQQ